MSYPARAEGLGKYDINATIGKEPQNSKCTLFEESDETIHHIVCEGIKCEQKKNESWHDWLGKSIYWEICKVLNFDLTTKWYIYEPED